MKRLISLIVLVFFLINCQDSNPVMPLNDEVTQEDIELKGRMYDKQPREDVSLPKVFEPGKRHIKNTVTGKAQFVPSERSGGYLGNNTVFYPAELSIENEKLSVFIIRNIIQLPSKNGLRGEFWGKFKIVVQGKKSKPSKSGNTLFSGKYVGTHNHNDDMVAEVKYTGIGSGSYKGSTLKATEILSSIKQNTRNIKELKDEMSPKVDLYNFSSSLEGVLTIKVLTDE